MAEGEKINLTGEAAGLIARLADGAMRDALSILDTCAGVTNDVDAATVRRMAGVTDKSYLFELSDAAMHKDTGRALTLVAQLREQSIDIKRLCDELILHYRNLLLAGVANAKDLLQGVSAQEEQRYLAAAKDVPQRDAVRAIKVLCDALDKMGKGTDARIELEVALFRLCEDAQAQAPVYRQAAQPQPFAAAPYVSVPAAPPAQSAAASAAPEDAPPWDEPAAPKDAPPWDEPAAPKDAPVQAGAIEQQAAAAQPTQPAEPKPAPAQILAPPVPLAEGITQEPFAAWHKVLAAMENKDKLLFVNMRNSKAYYDGKRVLIDGSDLFLEYMRKNEYSSDLIKQTIAEVTGARYAIGPYKKPKAAEAAQQTAEAALELLTQQGVEVIFENEP